MPSPEKILCLDMGNSRLKAQLWAGDRPGERLELDGDAAEWTRFLLPLLDEADGRSVLCSVRPSQALPLREWLEAVGRRPRLIRGDDPVPFPVDIQGRETLGADRLCNAAAAWAERLAPALLVDAGTAVTFDLIDGEGVYCGGGIMPGAGLSLAALAEGGEQLPRVAAEWPESPWGRDTGAALASGVLWGSLAALEGLARRFREEFGEEGAVVLTGGAAPGLAERWSAGPCRLEPDWTLRGIAALAGA